jgi:hypothetical protein
MIKAAFLYPGLILNLLSITICAENDTLWKVGIETSTSISYSGLNQILAATINYKENTFYIGPKISLSQSYLPGRGIWGSNAGISHIIASKGKTNAFINVDYQNSIMKPFEGVNSSKYNFIHEVNFSYGIQFRFIRHLLIGNQIGFGRYWEIYHDLNSKKTFFYRGYSGLIKVIIHYEF